MLMVYARFIVLISLTVSFFAIGSLLQIAFYKKAFSNDLFECFMINIVLGLSFIILSTVGVGVIDIPLTRNNLLNVAFVFLTALIFAATAKVATGTFRFPFFNRGSLSAFLIFIVFSLFLMFVRSVQIKDILVPNWVDGLIHTTHLNKLVFDEKIDFSQIYHIGFHEIALVIHYFWKLSLPESILLLGQWLSAMCGLTLYVLARRYTRNIYSSLFCIIVYSLFLFFPSYLISWGRYPFLLGLTLLPPAMITSLDWINAKTTNLFLALVLLASLVLAHYGSFLIWASFILVNIVYKLVSLKFQNINLKQIIAPMLRGLFLVTILSLFIIPKALHLLSRPQFVENMILHARGLDLMEIYFSGIKLAFDHDYFMVILWGTGILISAVWKKRLFFLMICWSALVWALTWLQYFFLGFSISSYLNWIVFLSMPFAICGGMMAQYLYSQEGIFESKAITAKQARVLAFGFLCLISFAGGYLNIRIIDSRTVMFTPEDQIAMDWISANTPVESLFLINSFIWGDALMPSDGGGWIPFLTGRAAVYPKKLGEFYDVCVFINKNNVDYIYIKTPMKDDGFGLRLSDINAPYRILYSSQTITVVSVTCP